MNKEGYPKLQKMKLADLKPASYNPRKISSDALGRLTKSLSELGNLQPITWNAKTGNIVGGHQRLKCYSALQKEEVEVWAVWLDEAQEKAANIALNKLSGEFDLPALKDILEEIDTGEIDLDITGFGADELADLMEQTKPEASEDDVPEVPVEAVTKPGDLYILGEHRLLCGDATKESDLERLMDGKQADLLITDPPYGVSYADKNRFLNAISPANRIQKPIENDHMSAENMNEFWDSVLRNAHKNLTDKSSYYIFSPQGGDLMMMMMMSIKSAKFQLKHMLVWVKNNHVLGRCDYHYKHEPVFYGWKEGGTHNFYGGSSCFSVLNFDKPLKSDLHPTMKPVGLFSYLISNSTKQGDLVLDLFLGSGTALIAAEQAERKCNGLELSPQYCDVIVKRWENLTGKKACLEK